MRARRIENEWLLLEELQQANSQRLQLIRDRDSFSMRVDGVPALTGPPADPAAPGPNLKLAHGLRIVFPRYFPTMPAELYLDAPVFHPNIHPDTGFVCLWTKHRVQTTVEQTLAQLQRVLAWDLVNTSAEHVVQPEALHWYTQPGVREHLPLKVTPLVSVHPQIWEIPVTVPHRQRLS